MPTILKQYDFMLRFGGRAEINVSIEASGKRAAWQGIAATFPACGTYLLATKTLGPGNRGHFRVISRSDQP